MLPKSCYIAKFTYEVFFYISRLRGRLKMSTKPMSREVNENIMNHDAIYLIFLSIFRIC